MKILEQVLNQHFNGRPTEMHYGCNKPIIVKRKPRPNAKTKD